MKTAKQVWFKILSMVLTFALLIACVPNHVFAMAGEALMSAINADDTVILQTEQKLLGTEHIVEEDTSKRGESYKEYILNNGLRLATIYPSAIHYEDDGAWKDIDNTLIATLSGGSTFYTNTAGKWNVRFPQSLNGSNMIGITKDGFTLQFGMAGELRSTGDVAVASAGQIGSENTAATLAVSAAQTSTAQIQQIDLTAARAAAEHPETVLDTLNSRLTYANIYPNTNVVYDLQGNQLKESIILQQYDSTLWGYRYTLDTGNLVPVMNEDQQIDLCNPETNEVVLTMPAPYMLDSKGEYSYDVDVSLVRNGSNYLLSYYLPREWLADADRVWPVILDPVVTTPGTYSNVKDITVRESGNESSSRSVVQCGYSVTNGAMRFYMQFIQLPTLTSADVIADATISLYKPANSGTTSNVDVHGLAQSWESSTISWTNQPSYDGNIADYVVCRDKGTYTWNITGIVRDWYEIGNFGMVFKVPDAVETESTADTWKQFYSSDDCSSVETMPMLTITYQNHNGLEDYWSYSSSSAGRAGTGYVNLFTGNLTWVRGDLGFDGNRMPVSISHVYNSNDAQENEFGMGYGWRTNYNQTITSSGNGIYIWEDGDGTRHQFVTDSSGVTTDVDGMGLTLTVTSTGYLLTDLYGNSSEFTGGKLTRMANNLTGQDKVQSDIEISYDSTTGFISQLTDGAGRKYHFYYQSGLLSKICYTGTGNTELTRVRYAYTNGDLIRITDNDSSFTAYAYDGHLLVEARDISAYKIFYSYTEGEVMRVADVREYNGTTLGNSVSFTYGTHYTEVLDQEDYRTHYQFNDWGNLVATYDSAGHSQYTKYALNDVNDPIPNTAELHQMIEISDIDGTTNNLLPNNSFEDGELSQNPSGWTEFGTTSNLYSYRGNQSMRVSAADLGDNISTGGPGYSVAPGETYTFSVYVYSDISEENDDDEAIVEIRLGGKALRKLVSEASGWTRMQVSYTNEGNVSKTIYPGFHVYTGTVYLDCVQIEKTGVASAYNEVINGEFQSNGNADNTWKDKNGNSAFGYYSNTDAPNLVLSNGSVGFTGNPNSENYFTQDVMVSGYAGDAFVLAGWAKANAVPLRDTRQFGLKLIFHNVSLENPITEHYVSFDPDIPFEYWQYAALTAVAEESFSYITIQLVYNSQANAVRFDGVQLTQGRAGTTYTYDTNKNVETETNILGQTTTYEYHTNGIDLKGVDAAVGSDVTYEYDVYHNVTKMVETILDSSENECSMTYTYEYDAFCNLTSVTVTQATSGSDRNSLTQKSITEYTYSGNYVAATIDGNGDRTAYGYNEETGVLEWVQYPEDTVATRTHYEYDNMYRLTKTSTTTDQDKAMFAQYSYDNDLLENLATQSTTYSFTYDNFDLRTSVSIGDDYLVQYHYTNDKNHYLESLDYANGSIVRYTYDILGRIIKEAHYEDINQTWPSRSIRYFYDNTGATARMIDSATGIETICTYDSAGRVLVMAEIYSPYHYREVVYTYDTNGNVTKLEEIVTQPKTQNHFTVLEQAIYGYDYFYDHKNRIEAIETNDSRKEYQYDSLDRVTQEIVSSVDGEGSTEVLRNEYTYANATVNGTSVTTYQVASKETTADMYQNEWIYEYDGNGNIVSIRDGTGSGARAITYVYDSADQLIRENNPYVNTTWVWTYDGAGNITSKKEYAYTTDAVGSVRSSINYGYPQGDESWGDLLIAYNGQTLSYDGGNLINDGTWTYTWQQGGQLATMSDGTTTWTYTYDANGMRIGRTNGTDTYSYIYNGGLLSHMTKDNNVLYFTYDAAGMPLTVNLNGITYYYVTNLQGDVVAILDSEGYAVVHYVYDAWGYTAFILDETEIELGSINPLRYRGYVYDQETGLYYLQSRYYNPAWGRFISADNVMPDAGGDTLGYNLFAYCLNNPVNLSDQGGNWPSWATKLLIGTAVIAAAAILTVATAGTGTALACFAVGALKGAAIGAAMGAASGAATGAITHRITTGSWEGAGQAALEGAADGYMMGAITGFISGGLSSDVCFVAGTTVLASSGYVAIETVEAGDYVWAADPETGEVALKQVVQTFVNEATELIHVTVKGEEIVCTTEHPFYSPVKGWIAACKLRAGDILVTVNGEYVVVEKVQHKILESPVKVYNFEVEGFHTYYVSSIAVLVHNLCSQRAAMREAKRSVNIPMSQRPDAVQKVKMIGENGRTVFAKLEIYGNKYIRNDLGGHLFSDGMTMARHFNAGTIKKVGNAVDFISNNLHFFY